MRQSLMLRVISTNKFYVVDNLGIGRQEKQ